MGQERQHARVVRPAGPVGAHLPDDQLRQPRFEFQTHGLGRSGHRLAQLRAGQRTEHHVPVLQRIGQFRMAQALLVEVGPYAEEDEDGGRVICVGRRARGVQDLDEGAPVGLVGAEGERLLELVHDDDRTGGGRPAPRPCPDGFPHRPREMRGTGRRRRRILRGGDDVGELGDPAGQLGERIGSRYELHRLPVPAVLVAQRAAVQRRHQAGVQQGGLSRPGGAHEHDQAARLLRRAELSDEGLGAPLPAEEPPGVLRAVRRQPAVGADTGDGRGFGRGLLLLVRGGRGPVADRVGHRALPQELPLGQVVQALGHRNGPQPPRLGDQDVQHRGEGGELGGRIPGPSPVADPLRGHPHGPPAFVDPATPDDGFGHTLEGRITGLLVQQCETFREGRACP